MAEIEVRRRRPAVWPWVVGLTVAAVLVWLLSERFVAPSSGAEDDPAEQVRTPPASGPVRMAQRSAASRRDPYTPPRSPDRRAPADAVA
jgi:hypothetical protein